MIRWTITDGVIRGISTVRESKCVKYASHFILHPKKLKKSKNLKAIQMIAAKMATTG